jgi:glycine cleavage system H lipoate-binding protein
MKRNREGGQAGDGFLECVWMRAGVVDFRLCDREYDCENCPLDRGISQAGRRRGAKAEPGARGFVSGREIGEAPLNVHGYAAPPTLFYHPRHVWVRIEEAGRVRVGLDDFGQKLTGRVYSVTLPELGSTVDPSCADWRIVHRAGETALTVPVAGVVEESNDRLAQQPSLVNREPYGAGAAFVLRPKDLLGDLKGLYYGRQVERWFDDETHALHGELFALLEKRVPSLGQTLQDGGVHIEDLSAEIGAGELQRLIDRFLAVSAPRVGKPAERRK